MRPSFLILYLALSTAFVPVAAAAAATQRTAGNIPAGLQAALKPVESYRQLPLAAGLARLSGEIDTRLVPVYLLPFEAARPMRFRLSYMSAVSVLPEGSRLTLSINDVVVGERELRATSNPEALTFDVPAGLLESGFNAVRITVRHAHRVDCSRDASYELWTLILPEQSGFAISGPAVELRDIRDLPAVRPTTAGVIRIRVRANPSTDSATLARHSRAVQAAVVIGRFSRPIVDVEAEDSGEPGLDILVGVDATLAPVLGAMPAGAGPRLHVVHDAQTDRVNLVVTGSTPEEVEAALRSFENAAMNGPRPLGSAAGLRSVWAENGFRVEGGERITLTQLGFSTQRFAGRYYRQSGIIQMPSDFYPGDYGRMVLNVDAAYAADLLPASRINVRVNGAVASTLSLQKSGGQTLTKRAAFLPLSAFKPGANTVTIEAETASAADAECSPTALSLPRDRFLLSQSSELVIPSLARIATFPSLSGVMAGSVTTSPVGAKKQIFIPRPSRELIDATFTLLGKIAAVSGGIAPVEFSFERPPEGAGHTLTLGALSDIPPSTLLAAGLDPEALRRAWQGEPEAHPETRLSATPVRLAFAQREWLTSSAPAASWALDPASPHEHAATLGDQLEGGRFETGDNVNRSDGAEDEDNLLERVAHIAAEAEEALRALLPFEFGERGLAAARSESTSVVKKTTSLVVAQGVAMKDLGQTRRLLPEVSSSTVIVSPTPELLQSSLSELLTSQLWQQLTGATAAFDLSQSQVHTANPESQALVPTQALSINNARLIAAGWLSHNVGIYTGVMALLALLLTALTYRLVRQTGVQE